MPKRLPTNLFADSPTRSTSVISGAKAASDSEVSPPYSESAQGATVGVPADSDARPTPELLKQTVYLPPAHVQAIEDEVYARRRAGERSLNFAEMHRQIIEEWVGRRSRRNRPSA